MSDINLAAIRRDDPYAEAVEGTASQVAVYRFNSSTNDWEKQEIEGAFFIYSRFAEPRHSLFVLNRLSKKNFMEPVVKELEIDCQLPFILFRNDQLNIYSIWFYHPAECKQIFKQLELLIKANSSLSRDAETGGKAESQDVLSLLMKAKEQQRNGQQIKDMKKTANSNSSQPISISNGRGSGSLSVAALFGRSNDAKETHAKERVPAGQTESGSDSNLLRRLMSVPADFESSAAPDMSSAVALEKDLKEVLKIGSNPGFISSHAESVPNLCQPVIPGIFPLERSPVPADFDGGVPLMSPMVFSDGGKPNRSPDQVQRPPLEQEATRALDLLGLLTPQSLVSSSPVDPDLGRSKKLPCQPFDFEPIDTPEVTPLTKHQLSQALIHLLKTDSNFVSTLHGAYLQSLERPRLGKKIL